MKSNLKEENKLMPFAIANWRAVLILGITMIFAAIGGLLLLITIPQLPVFVIVVFIIIFLPSGIQILYAGLVGKEFQNILLRIPKKEVHFDMLRLTMKLLVGERTFSILYHGIGSPYTFWAVYTHNVSRSESPPDHYQIWTAISWPSPVYENPYNLGRYLRRRGITGTALGTWVQREPPDDPLSDDLKEYGSPRLSSISSLCHVGVAKRGGSPVLIALLRRDATTDEIIQTIDEIAVMSGKIQERFE